MTNKFFDAIKDRRSYYSLSKKSSISDDRLHEIINDAVLHVPSAFNSQSARVVLLLGDNHNKLWDITKEALRPLVPEGNFADTENKINGFKESYGTILFFEDQDVIKHLQDAFSLYKDNFPIWSLQSSGMLQFTLWTALKLEGLGASLQHYNPLIDEDVKQLWNIPESWKLLAQMPFGVPTSEPDVKDYSPLEDRVKVYK